MNPNTPAFPYAPSTDINLSVASNNAQTTLTGSINNSVTTIPVADNTSFTMPALLVIDGEIIQAQGTGGSTSFVNCVRGYSGTTAASHTSTTPVYGRFVSYHYNQVASEINSMSTVLFNGNFNGLKKDENLLTYSEAFENGSAWFLANGATISATNGTSPIGDTTARTLLEGSSAGVYSVSSNFSNPVIGNTYTFSVYASFLNARWLTIGQNIANDVTRQVCFDIQNGIVGEQGSAALGAIVPLGNGWFRCLVVTTCTSATPKTFDIALARANGIISYVGSNTLHTMVWGAQVTSGGMIGPNSYMSTSGVIVSLYGDLVLDEGVLS